MEEYKLGVEKGEQDFDLVELDMNYINSEKEKFEQLKREKQLENTIELKLDGDSNED